MFAVLAKSNDESPRVFYFGNMEDHLEMAARQKSLEMITCRLRFAKCSQMFSPQICTKTSGAFYIWARKLATSIMNQGNIQCL